MIIGFACGLLAGAIIALVLPRDDGPRRRTLTFDPDLEPGPGPVTAVDGRAAGADPAVVDPDRTAGSGELPGA